MTEPHLYDVYVVNSHGVHDVLYAVSHDEAKHIAGELTDGVFVKAGERPEAPKAKQSTTDHEAAE